MMDSICNKNFGESMMDLICNKNFGAYPKSFLVARSIQPATVTRVYTYHL